MDNNVANPNAEGASIKHENVNDDEIYELEHMRKLFIGGLAPITNEDSLKSFYEQWGKVVDVVVMRDPQTKRSRGFGFITYSQAYMVDDAQTARPHILDGKEVEAKRALPRPELGKPESNVSVRKIFVGGLKENHDEDCLKEYFTQFGNVIGVKVIHDKITGRKRGFAYIEFDDYDAVDKAVLQKTHSIKYVLVDVKKSVYKQELQKKQQYQQQDPSQQGYMGHHHQPQNNWNAPSYHNGYNQPPPANWNYPQQNANSWSQPAPQTYQGGWSQPPAQGYGAPPAQSYGAPPAPGYGAPPPAAPPAAAPYSAPDPNAQNASWGSSSFGGGYQQSYSGGPSKTHSLGSNRMNPYSAAPSNSYGATPAPTSGYGNQIPTHSTNGGARAPPSSSSRRY